MHGFHVFIHFRWLFVSVHRVIGYRVATTADVPAMLRSRDADAAASPGDERMVAYLEGRHHPHMALRPRIAFIAEAAADVAGYAAGHLTRRFECDGELQYLYVAPQYRRRGVAGALVQHLARWFVDQGARRVCVNVNADSLGALPFYRSLQAQALTPHWMVWPDIAVLSGDPDS